MQQITFSAVTLVGLALKALIVQGWIWRAITMKWLCVAWIEPTFIDQYTGQRKCNSSEFDCTTEL